MLCEAYSKYKSTTHIERFAAIGRRPVILINLIIMCAASIWCGKAKSFNSLLAARLVQGNADLNMNLLNPTEIAF